MGEQVTHVDVDGPDSTCLPLWVSSLFLQFKFGVLPRHFLLHARVRDITFALIHCNSKRTPKSGNITFSTPQWGLMSGTLLDFISQGCEGVQQDTTFVQHYPSKVSELETLFGNVTHQHLMGSIGPWCLLFLDRSSPVTETRGAQNISGVMESLEPRLIRNNPLSMLSSCIPEETSRKFQWQKMIKHKFAVVCPWQVQWALIF